MADLIVFNILIPDTDDSTGLVHPPEKFDDWLRRTVARFGGATVIDLAVRGLWFDESRPPMSNPVEDHHNWYKIAVAPDRVNELREYVRATAREFGQRYLYFERAGEVEFVEAR